LIAQYELLGISKRQERPTNPTIAHLPSLKERPMLKNLIRDEKLGSQLKQAALEAPDKKKAQNIAKSFAD
jgi:hypothetical protein